MAQLMLLCLAVGLPVEGDWIRYRVLPASEWRPVPVETVELTVGPAGEEGAGTWWELAGTKPGGRSFRIRALSDRVPMAADDGDIGIVYRYQVQDGDRRPLEYRHAATGRAHLPRFGFRDGLVPTPRLPATRLGPLWASGRYLGQPITAVAHGTGRAWAEFDDARLLVLDDDILMGTCRAFRDDGSGPGEDGEYRYVPLAAEDYARMMDAGFNIFPADPGHLPFVRDRPVFFIKTTITANEYPQLLYRANFWGTRMFVDEPASRLDAGACRSVYDAANLLMARNQAYFSEPGGAQYEIMDRIQDAGFSLGDWRPWQMEVPIGETYQETAMYQMRAGAAGIMHEGRYRMDQINADLARILGPGAEMNVQEALRTCYAFMRGAVRCLGGEWGVGVYGQMDYALADDAVRTAYDLGAQHIWFWTSDHDHHLPFERQLETARTMTAHRRAHPRPSRQTLNRAARTAVAVPVGYQGTAYMLWWNSRFDLTRHNPYGARYGDVLFAYWAEIYRLAKAGADFDVVVDWPELVEQAGYERVIRVSPHGEAIDRPAPRLAAAPVITVSRTRRERAPAVRQDAPRLTARAVTGEVQPDGRLTEWEAAEWIALASEGAAWARAAFLYSPEALFVAVEVEDETHVAAWQGDEIWRNDSVQVGLDPLFNKCEPGRYGRDDTELGFSLVDGKPYAHIWFQGTGPVTGSCPAIDCAIVRGAGRTTYEARVPREVLAPLSWDFPGHCGLNIVVNDTDGPEARQVASWTSGLADGKYPDRWGVMVFEPGPDAANIPLWHLAPERTVVRRGEPVRVRLHTGVAAPREATLSVQLQAVTAQTEARGLTLALPQGASSRRLSIATSGLAAGAYDAVLRLTGGAGQDEPLPRTVRLLVLED